MQQINLIYTFEVNEGATMFSSIIIIFLNDSSNKESNFASKNGMS